MCYNKLIQHFGESIRSDDGTINRKVLGSIVFSDKNKMTELESIVWPEIKTKINNLLTQYKKENIVKCVVVEAAIMIEAGWQDLVDTLWVVSVEPETAKQRLIQRNSLSEEDALKRINSQMKNSDRISYANHIIDNNDLNPELLEKKVCELYSSVII